MSPDSALTARHRCGDELCNVRELNPALFRWPTPVVGHRCYVFDTGDSQTRGLEGPDRRFTAGSGTFDHNVHGTKTVVHRLSRGGFSGTLRSEGRSFARSAEPYGSGARPGQHIAVWLGKGHDCVVKRRGDERVPLRDKLPLTTSCTNSSRHSLFRLRLRAG